MTITLQSVELYQPVGELDCDFFPTPGDLDAKIGGWLTAAKAKVLADTSILAANHNEATKQWVYYLAYSYLAGKFAAMPNSVSVNNGADSVSYGQDRPAFWATKASLALTLYNGFQANVTTKKDSYTGPINLRVVM